MDKPDWPQRRIDPARFWYWSTRLHRRSPHIARAIKLVNFVVFRAVLPPKAQIESDLQLGHSGLNVVCHPNLVIGRNVHLWHGVNLVSDAPTSGHDNIVIEDDVVIGAGATVVNKRGHTLTIGRGAVIGAGAVVTKDVPAHTTWAGNPARQVRAGRGERLSSHPSSLAD